MRGVIHNFSGKVITEKAVRQLEAAHSKATRGYYLTGTYLVPVLSIQTMTGGKPSGMMTVKITQAGCVYPHNLV